jgi:4'-phosphopantetheinyl transferase
VARADEVGIDIERVRPVAESEQIAARFFSERECDEWRSLPARLQTEAFLNCWTRKEAWLKASGEGITESLKQIEVSLCPGEPAPWRGRAGERRAAAHCLLQDLTPAAGYVGALAVRSWLPTGTSAFSPMDAPANMFDQPGADFLE